MKFYGCTFSVGTFRQTPCVCPSWGAGSPGWKWQSVGNSFNWNRARPVVVKQFVWIIPSVRMCTVLGKGKKRYLLKFLFTWSPPVGGASIWARAIPAANAANANSSKTTLVRSFILEILEENTLTKISHIQTVHRESTAFFLLFLGTVQCLQFPSPIYLFFWSSANIFPQSRNYWGVACLPAWFAIVVVAAAAAAAVALSLPLPLSHSTCLPVSSQGRLLRFGALHIVPGGFDDKFPSHAIAIPEKPLG